MKKLLLLASVVFAPTGFAQKISNKIGFKKGQKYELVTEMKRNTSSEMMGQSMESTVNSTMTESYDIEDVNSNGIVIEYKVKRLTFSANGMGGSQEFDSEKEDDRKGEIGKILEKSLKNKYKMTIDPYGKIISVKADDDNPNPEKNAEQDAIAGIVSTQLGLNFTVPKEGDISIFKFLPGREISSSDTWVDSSNSNGVNRLTTYKVNSVKGNDVVLDYTEQVSVNTTQNIMGTDASFKSNDKTTGQVILDKNTGVLKQKTATIETKGTIEGQGMTVPTSGTTQMTVTVKNS
jgi:hypothetical protein